MTDVRALAESRFQRALEEAGGRDPREFYRERLRALRERDPEAYLSATTYFEHTLLPALVRSDTDPISEWLEYGRLLASLTAPGETVQIDATGRAAPYSRPVPSDRLVLHLPASTREPVLAVGLPPRLSPAQRAAFELLVNRRTG